MAITEMNKMRKRFNYKEDNILPYKNFCYQHRREKGEMKYLKVEYLLILYHTSDIKQKKRLSNKIKKLVINCADKLYRDYVLFKIQLNQSIEIYDYHEFPYFYEELKSTVSCDHEYKTTWHDIDLKFNDSNILSQFKNQEFINEYSFTGEDSYYRALGNKIIKLEKSLRRIFKNTENNKYLIRHLEMVMKNSENLSDFLRTNHLESAYLQKLISDTQEVYMFFENLEKFKNCKIVDPTPIVNFKTPMNYACIDELLEKLKKQRKYDRFKLKKFIKMKLSEHLLSESKILVPFPPVFYDIAFDFISYPDAKGEKSSITELLGKLNIFGKK